MTIQEFERMLPGGPHTKQKRVLRYIAAGNGDPFSCASIKASFNAGDRHHKIHYSTIREIILRFVAVGVVTKRSDGLYVLTMDGFNTAGDAR